MNISLYNTKSDKRSVHKNLVTKGTKSAVLKDNNSVTHPYLVLETFEGWEDCNYLYIDEFNRYYYIDDKKPMIGNKLSFTCSVDVLMSFSSEILELTATIDKQSSASTSITDQFIDDGSLVIENRNFSNIINFNNGFNENGEYILITAGVQGGVI